ncbi:MAG: HlyD family secretion protein, partial [Clostridiales bacterium]|nr:HlyD family secretion protein [Clostridiales bacterium]
MKKGTIITIATMAVVVAAVGFIAKNVFGKETPVSVNTTSLERGELVDSVSVKGVVESTDSKNVYAAASYKIKTVNVELGDVVSSGDILCELDVAELERQIRQRKAELDATQQSNYNQLSSSMRSYEDAKNILDSGKNANIINAGNAIKTAEITLSNARKNYEDKIKELNESTNASVVNALNSLKSAGLDLTTKQKTLEDNTILYNEGIISYEVFHQSEIAVEAAQNSYNSNASTLENAQNALNTEIESLKKSLDSAEVTYNNAVAAEEAARIGAEQDIKTYEDRVTSAEVSMNSDSQIVAIQNLEEQIKDSIVASPISGTVTAVYATEGAISSGLLFVVEDTNSLKVITKIKEYDSGRVALGQEVEIKTDVTGDEVFKGVIDKIAPTSVKGANGEPLSTDDVEFETEVKVLSESTPLKIGMNTRLTIVVKRLGDVFYVPYDAVLDKTEGVSV